MPNKDALPHQVVNRRVLIEADNLLWDQYAVYVDLFKFYVDLAWKSTTWYYAITGVVLAYVLIMPIELLLSWSTLSSSRSCSALHCAQCTFLARSR